MQTKERGTLTIFFIYIYNMQTKERVTYDTGDGDKKNLLYFLYTYIICKGEGNARHRRRGPTFFGFRLGIPISCRPAAGAPSIILKVRAKPKTACCIYRYRSHHSQSLTCARPIFI